MKSAITTDRARNMIDFFYSIDLFFFHLCNSWIANPIMDTVMPFVTEVKNFYAVYILLFIWLLWRGGKKGRICAAVLAVAVLIADPLNSQVIKEMFARQRPCHFLNDVRLLVPCGGAKSFPSTHAVNNFIAALVISSYFPRSKWLVYSIASMVAFSRVYVGVHYPSDVIGGAIEGIMLGVVLIMAADIVEKYIVERIRKNKNLKSQR